MTLPALMGDFWGIMLSFVFLYPVLMSCIWMIGGLAFYFRYERHAHRVDQPPPLDHYPVVTILVPCFDEEANARETMEALMLLRCPPSKSSRSMTAAPPAPARYSTNWRRRIRVCMSSTMPRTGKATGLNTATLLTKRSSFSVSTASLAWTPGACIRSCASLTFRSRA